jgi:hypothetical protein
MELKLTSGRHLSLSIEPVDEVVRSDRVHAPSACLARG